MIRWGVLSTAKIGEEHVIPAILEANNAQLQAIASRDLTKAQTMAERFGAKQAFGSYEDLLASKDIDAIYIPLPTSHHVEWAIKAASSGKHVLVEKPVALNASDISAIIEARDEHDVLVSEAFMVTYHPQWHKVRALLADGAIGTLQHVQSAFSYHNLDETNMRNIASLGGGALPDIGVYPVVTTRFATGTEPERVTSKIRFDEAFGTDVYSTSHIDFGTFDMTMYVSTQMALRQQIVFHGDKGFIEVAAPFNAGLYDADVVSLHNTDHSERQDFRFSGVNQYKLQIQAFGQAVQSRDASQMFSLESSIANQRVIDAIFRAGESGHWEDV